MKFSLYYAPSCGFCHMVIRAAQKLPIDLELRDVSANREHYEALMAGGGRRMVPCLRMDEGEESTWMYESSDIIDHLQAVAKQ